MVVLLTLLASSCSALPFRTPTASGLPPIALPHGESWDPVSVCGQILLKTESIVGEGEGPPLEMVVLGDSILWGQGLLEEQKTSALVQKRIAERLRRRVRKRVYAHSGARVVPRGTRLDIEHGEVPVFSPHVGLQTECVPGPEKVDLVIVTGCINDVDGATVIDPASDPDSGLVEERTRSFCGEPMRELLARVAARFPKARVILAGYYPFFSDRTPKTSLRFVTAVHYLLSGSDEKAPSWETAGRRLVEKSARWQRISNEVLSEVVESLNRRPESAGRMAFAAVPVGPEHAYGAEQSMLWGIVERDPVATGRWWRCLERKGLSERLLCINASAFHPNPRGAAVYAEAICRALDPALAEITREATGIDHRRSPLSPAPPTGRYRETSGTTTPPFPGSGDEGTPLGPPDGP